jgi:hypothetical protein
MTKRFMRTTLVIDDDVLSAAKEMAAIEKKSVGEVNSSLARRALSPEESKGKTRKWHAAAQGTQRGVSSNPRVIHQLREELPQPGSCWTLTS